MAHAGVAPLSGPAAATLSRKAHEWSLGFSQEDYEATAAHARHAAALSFGVQPHEVALMGPTSLALSMVALGLPWQQGDEVIIHSQDYPANVYIWRALASRGVIVREILPETPGQITVEQILPYLRSGRVRLVALASAHFLTGSVLDTAAIGRTAHKYGALFCLDAIQTLGSVVTDLQHVDFICADSHKWMLGPVGAGLLIVKEHVQDVLSPVLLGAENVRTSKFIPSEKINFVPGAARYEPGVLNLPGIAAMSASLDMLSHWGIAAVQQRITSLKLRCWELLRTLGAEFLGAAHELMPGGILTFRFARVPTRRIYEALLRRHVITSLRWSADGCEWIRLSPHVGNTASDCETVFEIVRDLLNSSSSQ